MLVRTRKRGEKSLINAEIAVTVDRIDDRGGRDDDRAAFPLSVSAFRATERPSHEIEYRPLHSCGDLRYHARSWLIRDCVTDTTRGLCVVASRAAPPRPSP